MRRATAVLLLLLVPAGTLGNTCLLVDALQNQEWEPEAGSVFPNSLCIFPDGRSGLSNAVFTVEMVFGALYQPWGEPLPCDAQFLGKGIDFEYSGQGVILCGEEDYWAPCEFLPCQLNAYTIAGGGHTPVDGNGQPLGVVRVIWVPEDCPSGCSQKYVELYINSPDINGDLVVSLSDVGLFSADLYGSYNYRSDFNFDGVINLSDNGIFASAFGIGCQ
jgi:hypothetical protein